MNELHGYNKESLKIHYFLLNSGFNYLEGSKEMSNDVTTMNITPSKYSKDDLSIHFEPLFRMLKIFKNSELVLDINNTKVDKTVDGLDSSWVVSDIGDELTLDDILTFFRNEKIKDLFKDV